MDRKSFIDKLAGQLKEWDAEIEKFEAKAQQAQADAKISYDKNLQELRDKKKTAKEKLDAVKNSNDEAWQELRSGTEQAFDTMRNAFQAALAKFS